MSEGVDDQAVKVIAARLRRFFGTRISPGQLAEEVLKALDEANLAIAPTQEATTGVWHTSYGQPNTRPQFRATVDAEGNIGEWEEMPRKG